MNTSLNNRRTGLIKYLTIALLAIAPLNGILAQDNDSEFGVWTTIEASKKLSKKFKLDFEAEMRTIEGVSSIERYSFGVGASYKLTKWLKVSAGYIFMYCHKPETMKLKWDDEHNDYDTSIDLDGNKFYNYNVDHSYWTERHRFHFTLSGEYKIGRVELSLRERLQYTRTNSAMTDETKYRYSLGEDELDSEDDGWTKRTEPELKEPKYNTTLRSRFGIKWNIPKCKINPFASVELYSRLDDWKGCDKMRYRIGASYKINKQNALSLFYLYQDANDDDEPKGHAVGLGYSIDL